MRRFTTFVLVMVLAVCQIMAQAPEKFTYQAVVRNANNQLMANTLVGMRLSILQGSSTGSVVYSETQMLSTNANGLVTLNIGEGTVVYGNFSNINWSSGMFFLKSEIDPTGGSNYTISSTQQLLSVPYALFANEAGNGFSGDYNDLTNKPNLAPVATSGNYSDLSNSPQIPQIPQNVSAFYNDAGYITMDSVPTIPTNVSAFYNDVPYLTSFTEQQVLSIRNDTIFLTGGSFVKLPAGFDGDYNSLTNKPNLFDGNYNSLTNKPNLAPVATSGAYNDLTGKPNLATVATSGDYNDLSNRPQIPQIPQNVSAFYNDVPYLTSFTEQQVLSLRNDTIFLTGGSFVKLPAGFNGDYNSLTNKPNLAAVATSGSYNDITGKPNLAPVATSGDYNDLSNRPQIPQIPQNVSAFYNDVPYLTSFTEQQMLSIRNDTIFLTGGSFVKLPAGFDGNYNSLTNKPNLAPVATSGAYNDLTGKPNLATVATSGDYNDLSNRPQIPQIPQNVSAFNNDAGYITGYTETDPQYNAWNKDYNDLINKPIIPNAANNATLTIQRNGSTVGTFTADASVNETVNIAVPTTTSELTNNSSFVTADQLTSLIGAINHRMDSLQTVVSSQNAEISTLSHTVDSLRDILTPSSTGCTPWNTSVTNETACAFYVWHGEIYTQSGIYLYGCTNADGTNNMEALNLTIHQPDTTHLRAEACESYSWNNTTYTKSGSYYQKLTNKNGCDSVIVLHLTIFNGTHNVFTKDTCEIYTWNGQTYTESGIYTYAYTNADGCASVDTLLLTIYHGTHNVIKEIVCESYTWHDTLYTESGIYTYTYENEYGCASVDTLYLTVHYSTHNVETLNACGSYEWHGQTYTESGTYTYAYNNEHNCSSVDTLKVVVILVDEKSCSLAPCVTDVDGNMYSTVQIGGQCWMRSNLRTTHYADSTAIPTGNISSTDPYYYDSQSNRLDLAIRGYHYNQPAVMHNQSFSTANPSGVQGVCPDGWHVPSENEWQQLFTFVGSQVQHVCDNDYIEIAKALASPTGWRNSGNTCQLGNDVNNNLTGFTAFPTGQWENDMSCWGTDFVCTFWSSTAGRPFTPGTSPQIGNANRYYGFPVRCVYDISACGTEFEGTHNVETDTTCDSYTWHRQTYTESGAYTYPYKNIYGCASEDTLKLTIHHSTHNVDVKNLFGSYTWYDSIYTETGTYTYEYTNEYGCPSVDTLHLTRGYYPCPGTPTVTDHEGNVYNTVQIGNQCWTKENMRCITSPSTGANIFIPGTGGNTSYVSKFARNPNAGNSWVRDVSFYGLLYNWNAAVDTFNTSFSETGSNDSYSQNAVSVTFNGHRRGICPQGWHVPSDSEWTQLTNYVSSQEQFLCDHNSANIAKALVSPTGWRINSDSCGVGNSSTNNQTGFTAVPSGYYTGLFPKFGYGAGFWSATQREDVNNIVWGRHIFTDNNPTGMTRADDFYKSREYSVRCLKDTFSSDGTECMGTHNVEIKKANNTYTWHGQTYTESGTYTNVYTNEDGCYSVDTLKLTIVFVDEKSCPSTPSVTDIDGNTYSTVQIGEQCWMRSNLRTTRYADGTAVPAGNSAYSETDPYYYDYENCFTLPERGYYYNWPAVMHGQTSSTTNPSEVQGICPDGWHVPSELEWKQMTDYLANKSEYYCSRYDYFSAASLASNTGWTYYGGVQCAPGDNTPHNATGFSAIPAGYYQLVGRIGYASYVLNGADCTKGAYFWGSTENSADNAYYRAIDNMSSGFNSRNVSKDVGFSVRCVMNAETDSVDYTIDEKSCPGTATVTDIDGNTYGTVQLGEQCWMRSNLRATHYADGTTVPAGNMNFSKMEPYYYDFSGLGSDGTSQFFPLSKRGYLYNWPAAMHGAASSNTNPSQVQGICPDGWHVPSNEEWTQLENYVTSQNQYSCCTDVFGNNSCFAKALTSTLGWKYCNGSSNCYPGYNPSANNATGFNAMPVGIYAYNGYQSATEVTWFLSSTENDSASIHFCMLWYDGTYLGRFIEPKDKGYSVRCLKDTASSGGDTPYIGTHNVETESSCGNYTWHGQTYSESGTYTYSYTNDSGCASVDTLKLTIRHPVASTSSATACESYTWNGQTYTQSGDYTQTLTAANGCDSVVTLHLTINQPVASTSSATACESYSWNGTTYTQSGDYTQTFTAANGCDSVVTLHLTIYQPVATTSSATACESYTWHEQTYTQSGDYTYNYTNEYGCPCTETLNLTINHGSHNVFTETAEGSYTWHEQTYTESGTYTYAYTNDSGCPSVDTLHLTVSSVTPIIPTDTVEDGQPCPGTPTVADHEGNVYNTVQIGTQCWTKENMRCTTSPKGYLRAGDTLSYSVPYYFDDNTSPIPLADRGLLYNWVGAMDTTANTSSSFYNWRGICPAGWHVPQDGEWGTLVRYVSSQSNYLCNNNTSNIGKALASTQYWTETTNSNQYCFVGYNQSANNATGFSAVPAGCFNGSEFVNSGIYAQFCSSSSGMTKYLWSRKIINNEREVTRIYSTSKRLGLSVRCLKDTVPAIGSDTLCIGTHNVETENACESFTWHGQTYTASGTYTYAYNNDNGCPSADTLHLTIYNGTHNTYTETAEGSYTWHEQTYTESGTYTYTYTNASGCASVDTLHLTVTSNSPTPPTPPSDTIADGYPCPNAHTATDHEGNVYNTVLIGSQCWTKENMRCTTSPSTGTTILEVYPNGTSYTGKKAYYVNGNSYNTPSYGLLYNWNAAVDTFNTAYGETSTNSNSSNAVSVAFTSHRRGICPQGWHVPSDAEWTQLINYVSSKSRYQCGSTGGSIAKALADTTGWNIYSIPCAMGNDLSANNATGFSALPAGAYFGSFYYFGDAADFWSTTSIYSNSAYYKYLYYDYAGVHQDLGNIYCGISVRCLMDSAIGGDTPCIGTHNVETEATCNSYTWHGQTYTASGTYTYAYNNDNGCPSADTLHLTIYNGTYNSYTESAEGSYTWHGQTYTQSGTYTYSYTNDNGCPSMDTLFLTIFSNTPVLPIIFVEDSLSCPGVPRVADHEGNIYNTVKIGNQCWTKENMRCTTSPSTGSSLLSEYSTAASKSASWHSSNTSYDSAYGLLYNWCAAVDTFLVTGGAPEVANATSSLKLYSTFNGYRRGICPIGWHVPSEQEWLQLLTYVYNQGFLCDDCDDPYLEDYNVSCIAKAMSSTTGWNTDNDECAVGYNMLSNNATGFNALPAGRYASGNYSSFGNYTYFWSSTEDYDRYSTWAYYTNWGYYYSNVERGETPKASKFSVRCVKDTISSHGGGDCIGSHNEESGSACDSYNWRGGTYTESGKYVYAYVNAQGCPCADTLHLVIHKPTTTTNSAAACESYDWHGQTLTASGTYTHNYENEFGCASTETLNLTIYHGTHDIFSAEDCESYTWHGTPYSASGIYTYAYTNEHGCPSMDTLYLAIQDHVNLITAAGACEEYNWRGQTLTASGSYTADFTNDHGCSCTETLNLTIYHGTGTTYTETTCTRYLWHNEIYTQNGEYTYAYSDEHGCPCVDTLRLTIGNPCAGTPTVTDHQGNVYNTVQIGSQCWTKENMRCTTSPTTGTNLLNHPDTLTYPGKMAYYVNHDPSTAATYGLLYNWNAAVDVYNHNYSETYILDELDTTGMPCGDFKFVGPRRGICPQGWHVPSDAEWAQMINYVKSQSEYWCGDNSANIAKSLAIDTGWVTSTVYENLVPGYYELINAVGLQMGGECAVCNNQSLNNATCFSALPAGYYFGPDNIWDDDGFEPNSSANFFSATQMAEYDPDYDSDPNQVTTFTTVYTYNAYAYGIFHFSGNVTRTATSKRYGNSVRCVKNEE